MQTDKAACKLSIQQFGALQNCVFHLQQKSWLDLQCYRLRTIYLPGFCIFIQQRQAKRDGSALPTASMRGALC